GTAAWAEGGRCGGPWRCAGRNERVQVEAPAAGGEGEQARREEVPGQAKRRPVQPCSRDGCGSGRDADRVVDERLAEAAPGEREVQPECGNAGEQVAAGDVHGSRCLSAAIARVLTSVR